MGELVKQLGNLTAAHRLRTLLHDGSSFRPEKGALIEWPCPSFVRFIVAGLLCLSIGWSSFAALGAADVPERSYDHFRTGTNPAETILTPANVSSSANQFHRRFVMSVDGKIEGSPLYASGINIAGGVHNVVYVATMHNTVYAFDADTGAQLSARWLGNPVIGDDLHALKPTTIHTEWGIAGTPVIDGATGTLYVVRWGYENGISGPTFRLFGLDMTNLANDKFGSVLIDGYNIGGTGFNRYRQMQRAGLALATKAGARLWSLHSAVAKDRGVRRVGWSRSTPPSWQTAALRQTRRAPIRIMARETAAVPAYGWQTRPPLSMTTATPMS
jgi:hypothetical protein